MKALILFLLVTAPLLLQSDVAAIEQPVKPAPLSLNQVIDTCAVFYGIPRGVIVGVTTLETGKGAAGVGRNWNNLFSIRAFADWKGKTSKDGRWRAYDTPAQSVEDFCRFVRQHYPHLFGRETCRWKLYGYGNDAFEKDCWALKFNNK